MTRVRLTVWGVPSRNVPAALLRMGLDRRRLHAAPGLTFWKLLGIGSGETFTLRDADPRHWALLTVRDDQNDDDQDDAGGRGAPAAVDAAWDRIAHERLDVDLRPLTSRGRWSGKEPFGAPEPANWDGPVASITRARLRPARMRSFWRAVPPVSTDLGAVPGLVLAMGVGEAPVGLQGTVSVWDSARELSDFAYRRAAHADVVRRTGPEGWYAEELFTRFAVSGLNGTFRGEMPGVRT